MESPPPDPPKTPFSELQNITTTRKRTTMCPTSPIPSLYASPNSPIASAIRPTGRSSSSSSSVRSVKSRRFPPQQNSRQTIRKAVQEKLQQQIVSKPSTASSTSSNELTTASGGDSSLLVNQSQVSSLEALGADLKRQRKLLSNRDSENHRDHPTPNAAPGNLPADESATHNADDTQIRNTLLSPTPSVVHEPTPEEAKELHQHHHARYHNNNTHQDDANVMPPTPEEDEAVYSYEDFDLSYLTMLRPYKEVLPLIPSAFFKPRLPPKSEGDNRKTLVLDLDETLVHCSVEAIKEYDWVFKIDFCGTVYEVYICKRPNLQRFLQYAARHFEVVVFTASQSAYAERVLDKIDPTGTLISHRLYRDSCLPVDGMFMKDLNVLGRDLSQTIIVDNSPHAFGYQLTNGIPITSWFSDQNDTKLLDIIPLLDMLHSPMVLDIRAVLNETFGLPARLEEIRDEHQMDESV